MKAILITVAGEEKKINLTSFDSARKMICEYGYNSHLEIINLQDGKMMLIDEEGKFKKLPLNEVATDLAHSIEAIYPSDYICGDVIIINDVDEFEELPYE
jgi:hypothetical protein